MDKAIIDLLEALEFARSQDANTLHMDLMYGEWTEDNLGAMIDAAVAAFRSEVDYREVSDANLPSAADVCGILKP